MDSWTGPHPSCYRTDTAHLLSSSSAGWGSWASPPSPPLSRSPRRSTTGQWFSSSAPHTEVRSMDRRGGRSCTPPARAPGSGVGLGGISDGYSCCQRPPTSWCRPPHIRTAGSRISHTGHSPELPSDTGFGHPKKERKLEVIQRKGHVIQYRQEVQVSHFCTNEYFIVLPAMMEAIRDISMFRTKFSFSSSYGDTSYSSYANKKGV